jgi:hypothetical protein
MLDRMGGLVLAVIAGVLVPAAAVMLVAARDPVPRACDSGQATSTSAEGAILYTRGADLWYSEGLPGRPRKLADYTPPRARPSASTSPSSPAPSPSASPSAPPPYPPKILAADISADRKVVAYLVADPPARPGSVGLELVSPLDPPGTAPVEAWYWNSPGRGIDTSAGVHVLDNGKVLFSVPLASDTIPPPSPPPSRPLPTPSPARSSSPVPTVIPSAGGSPAATPSPAAGVAVLLVAPSPKPAVIAQGPQGYFLAEGHTAWTDAKGYRLPPPLPHLAARVDGATTRVVGVAERSVSSPLARRQLRQLVVGKAGDPSTQATCVLPPGAYPAALAPDETRVAIVEGADTYLLDLSGTHAAALALTGVLLSWRS